MGASYLSVCSWSDDKKFSMKFQIFLFIVKVLSSYFEYHTHCEHKQYKCCSKPILNIKDIDNNNFQIIISNSI
ncbi:hypothetical protein C0J52_10864 [Blattella germanica]|nr:hypothetical protein C0J52_10864 [Blattella germanica]